LPGGHHAACLENPYGSGTPCTTGLVVFACLNLPCFRVQAPPLAVLSNQRVWGLAPEISMLCLGLHRASCMHCVCLFWLGGSPGVQHHCCSPPTSWVVVVKGPREQRSAKQQAVGDLLAQRESRQAEDFSCVLPSLIQEWPCLRGFSNTGLSSALDRKRSSHKFYTMSVKPVR